MKVSDDCLDGNEGLARDLHEGVYIILYKEELAYMRGCFAILHASRSY